MNWLKYCLIVEREDFSSVKADGIEEWAKRVKGMLPGRRWRERLERSRFGEGWLSSAESGEMTDIDDDSRFIEGTVYLS